MSDQKESAIRLRNIIWTALAIMTLVSCTKPAPSPKGEISISSSQSMSSPILAILVKEMLTGQGYIVNLQETSLKTGRAGLISGNLDIAIGHLSLADDYYPASEVDTDDPIAAFTILSKYDLENYRLVWLFPAPAGNSWGIAVDQKFSQAQQLRTMSDFVNYLNRGNSPRLITSDYFLNHSEALPNLQKSYGFVLKDDQIYNVHGLTTQRAEQLLGSNSEEFHFTMALATDGELALHNLVFLEDDLHHQLIDYFAPIVRKEVLDTHPDIADSLNALFSTLDLQAIQYLNARLLQGKSSPEEVARSYLEKYHFIK